MFIKQSVDITIMVDGCIWKKSRQQIWKRHSLWQRLALASGFTIGGAIIISFVDCAFAQIIPDTTLGADNSVVTPLIPSLPVDIISGGALQEPNLFHSFQEFNVDEGRQAYFFSPPGIQNILARVTGGNPSKIFGTLGTTSYSNLFLINPNGIIFGPNAILDVRGSFVATTANAIQFGEQGFFSASDPNTESLPLLTVNPSAFLFNQIATQLENSITVQAKAQLSVRDGHSLLLLGGNISPNSFSTGRIFIDGGGNRFGFSLAALNGRIDAGSVAEPGTVGLDIDGKILRLSFPDDLALADVLITNRANILANVDDDTSVDGRGIQLHGGRITLANGSRITAQTQTNQKGGDITIRASQLIVRDGSQISNSTLLGEGQGGNLAVIASELVEVSGIGTDGNESGLFTTTFSPGNAGELYIETTQLVVQDGARISAETDNKYSPDTGVAGALTIFTGQLIVQTEAQITAATVTSGAGGTLTVNATESVDLSSGGSLTTETQSSAKAGNLTITTGHLNVWDGALVSASTSSEGAGGSLTVNASDSVTLNSNGQLSVATRGAGAAGDLSINTNQLALQNTAQISASTSGTGTPGSIFINSTDSVSLSSNSLISTAINPGAIVDLAAQGGNIEIQTGSLSLASGAQVSASTSEQGNAGNILVEGADLVSLSGSNTSISTAVNVGAIGQGGNVNIQTGSLSVDNDAQISANTQGQGQAGSITATANTVDITNGGQLLTSTASNEDAGNINLNVQESITLAGTNTGLFANTISGSTGNGGDINVQTGSLSLDNQAQVSASTAGQGDTGQVNVTATEAIALANRSQISSAVEGGATGDSQQINLQTPTLSLTGNSQVSAATFGIGDAGSISVGGANLVSLSNSSISTAVNIGATGEGGDINVQTGSLSLDNQAQLSASTAGQGNTGQVNVTATEAIALANGSQISSAVEAGATGDSQQINLQTPTLSLINGAEVTASTSTASGEAGDVKINAAESVQLSGRSRLSVEATEGGTAGSLTVNTGQMAVQDGSQVTVSSPQGQAGNLAISANALFLNQGSLTAVTGTSGAEGGANITLQGLDFLWMENESLISANALEAANGGNINIDADFIFALSPSGSQGSDIIANAVFGNGGRVNITTQGLFGIQFRPLRTSFNDITATSEFGVSGTVFINTPGIDPSRGLSQLPTDLVDAGGLIDRTCSAGGISNQSSFTVTGRGGLPPTPRESLNSDAIEVNWVALDSENENRDRVPTNASVTSPAPKPIVEAQGWVKAPNGQIMLVAQAPTVTRNGNWLPAPSCQSSISSSFNR